ncbi:OLC1v1013079C1 [Oldenlandia corymbosa var. corymbosa]|uniref:OLC1v1013079C1 n=1 Tax=Oldenlandia corymbosa var. corymbosa TaxID=529605 RepID=A0AAV1DXE5_OLDCO|nr:OLC1v1013079C1 [Oldenlandia corymbosa var. corymbosa]
MSTEIVGCNKVASKSEDGRVESQIQHMKSQLEYLNDALKEVKEVNRELSYLLSKQQEKVASNLNLIAEGMKVLCDRFEVKQVPSYAEAKVKLLECKQNGRSIESYYEELEGMFLSSNVDENDYMLTDSFFYGLEKEYKQNPKIRHQSRLYEAYFAALEVEKEHDASCGWNGSGGDQGLVFGTDGGDQRTCIFRTKCSIGWSGDVDLVIDRGSSTNCVSEEFCMAHGIKMDPHTNPYTLQWVSEDMVVDVTMVTFEIGQSRKKGWSLTTYVIGSWFKGAMIKMDENVINFGAQTKGDDSLIEISVQEYQGSLTLAEAVQLQWKEKVVLGFHVEGGKKQQKEKIVSVAKPVAAAIANHSGGGTKRKAESSCPAVEEEEASSRGNKRRNIFVWSCNICEVSTTSEKHKSKEASVTKLKHKNSDIIDELGGDAPEIGQSDEKNIGAEHEDVMEAHPKVKSTPNPPKRL